MGAGLAAAKLIGGRYQLESLLGAGGMGEVWRARHVALNTSVAIKFLAGASAQKQSTRKRFLTEAQVTAQLKTRHAVQVFDFGITDEGQPYLVMELLDGETLGHRLNRLHHLDVRSTVRFLEQAARALDRAHGVGIVHRDFKPDNIVIVLDEEGRESVKVLDFGIAKLLNELDSSDVEEVDAADASTKAFASFTRTGTVLGTPLYMAPEQVRDAADLDLRADIWAFGVVAFQCLTGAPPFEGKALLDLFEKIANGVHPKATSLVRDLPAAFDAWFDIACAPDPSKRFASAKIAATQLGVALATDEALTSGSLRRSDVQVRDAGAPSAGSSGPLVTGLDELGQTLEGPRSARPSPPARVKTSDRPPPPGPASAPVASRFGRVTSVPPPLAPSRGSSSDHAVTTASIRAKRTSRRRVAMWAVLVAAPLAALATYKAARQTATTAIVRTTTTPPTATATTPPTTTTPEPPTTTATEPPTATVDLPHADAAAHAPQRPLPARSIAVAPSTSAPATPPSAAPPSPPPSAPPANTGASPFKLPPLGI